MTPTKGYEAAYIVEHGTPEQRSLLDALHDVKALKQHTPETEYPELHARVGELTQQIRNRLREG